MTWQHLSPEHILGDLQPLSSRRSSNATLSPTMQSNSPLSSPPRDVGDCPLLQTSPPPNSLPPTMLQRNSTNKLLAIFLLILCSSAIGLMSVANLLQGAQSLHPMGAFSLGGNSAATKLNAQGQQGLRRAESPVSTSANANNNNNANTNDVNTNNNPTNPTKPTFKLPVEERWRRLGDDLSHYECVAWRQTTDCSPHGALDTNKTRSCSESVANGASGYCEIRHKTSGKSQRVMEMFCDSLRPGVSFQCRDFATILSYGRKAPLYTHDPAFSYDQCRQDFIHDQKQAIPTEIALKPDDFFKNGLVIVVFDKVLESVYASIKSMRQMGCTLPVELWYMASEMDPNHVILQTLTKEYGAFLREIKDPRASKYYTKIYAVFYSAFDNVLLLDADNFAVRDPTYLFSTTEFEEQGAIFWPDFWRFKKTIFNIQPTSFVWDVLDLDPVDMFEQESGQVMVNRKRHLKAMNVMMYYAFHPSLLESMRLVWGDKDLFRFAWLKTNSKFHMIQMPPGALGIKLADRNVFCGVTMVQHDPQNQVLFLHRNQEKLSSANNHIVWKDLQQFKLDTTPLDEYEVRGANGGRYFPLFKRCYGKDIYYEKAFTVTSISTQPFAGLEPQLLDFVREAGRLVNATADAGGGGGAGTLS